MVSVSASYVITLYLPMQVKVKTKVQQRHQQCDRIDEEATPSENVPKR